MKQSLLILSFVMIGISVLAQDTTKSRKELRKEKKQEKIDQMVRQDEEGVLIYSKHSIFGVQLRTHGYGVFYEIGKMRSNRSTLVYRIDFTETKHPKEDKLPNGGLSIGNPYIYGKVNNFYQFHLGFGQQRILGQKGNKNGVAVGAVLQGGLLIGLLRPYYLEVDDNAGGTKIIKYTQEDSALFVGGFIYGGGGLGKGWNEMKFKPGAFVKTALRFDFGRFNEVVSGLEIGLSLEFYSSKIPIMLFQEDKQLFFQGHVALLFGHRK